MKYNKLSLIFVSLFLLVLCSIGSYATTTGGIITNDGIYTIHTFLSNGTFNTTDALTGVSVLIVAGGGGGGSHTGGSGGAGGLIYNNGNISLSVGSYNIVVGSGGAGSPNTSSEGTGMNGENSSFNNLIAVGGGFGAKEGGNAGNGGSGGSAGYSGTEGTGTVGQGYAGGKGSATSTGYPSGGSGGSGGAGINASGQNGGAGGLGTNVSINGTTICYAGGAGGASRTGTAGLGNCGGGNGGTNSVAGGNGTNGLGGGGGGGGETQKGGDGGAGIIIIRYIATSNTISYVSPTTNASVYLNYTGAVPNSTWIGVNVSATLTNYSYTLIDLYKNGALNTRYNGSNSTAVFNNFTNLVNGNYSFNASTYFTNGTLANSTTARSNIIVDGTAPTFTFNAPTLSNNTYWGSAVIPINVTVTDTYYNSTTINLYNGSGVLNQTYNTTNATQYKNFTVTLNGTYYFDVTGRDLAGNVITSGRYNITVDTNVPVVTFVAPTDTTGTYVKRNYILTNTSVTGTNLQNLTVRFYNGSKVLLYSNFTTSLGVAFFRNYTGLNNSIYFYNATACNLAGYCTNTTLQNITVDTINPTIVYNANSDANTTRKGTTLFFNVTSSDVNYKNTTFYLYKQNIINLTVSSTNLTMYYNYTGLTDGNWTFNATTYDLANNSINLSNRLIELDNTAPVVNFVAPTLANDSHVAQNYIAINSSVSDIHFANQTIYVMGLSNEGIYSGLPLISFSRYSNNSVFFLNETSIPDADYYFNVTAYDTSGNIGYSETRKITLDTDIPIITLVTPTPNNNTVSGNISLPINITVSTPNIKNITVRLSNSTTLLYTNISSVVNITPQYFINYTLPKVGSYSYNITSCDEANNCNTTGTYYYYYANNIINITGKNLYDNSSIQNFSVFLEAYGIGTPDSLDFNLSTTNGSIYTNQVTGICTYANGIIAMCSYRATFSSNNYITPSRVTDINLNASPITSIQFNTSQAIVSFAAYVIITNNKINANFTVNGTKKLNDTEFYLNAGSYNVTPSSTGYLTSVNLINVSALDVTTYNITSFFNQVINFTVIPFNITPFSTINYSLSVPSYNYTQNYSTTNLYQSFQTIRGLNYTFLLSGQNISNQTLNFISNSLPTQNISFVLYTNNINLTTCFYDESTLAPIVNSEMDIYGNYFSGNFTSGASSNCITIGAVPAGIYEYRYYTTVNSTNYRPRSYWALVPSYGYTNLSLYQIQTNNSQLFQRTFVDSGANPIVGYLEVQRAYVNTTGNGGIVYRDVEIASMDSRGVAVFSGIPNTQTYRFRVLNSTFDTLQQLNPDYLIDASAEIQIATDTPLLDTINTVTHISGNVYYQNTTQFFVYDYNGIGSNGSNFCLTVHYQEGISGTDTSTCSDQVSGTIAIPIDDNLNGSYNAIGYATVNGINIAIDADDNNFKSQRTAQVFGALGLVLLLMCIILFSTISRFTSPVVSIVGVLFSIFIFGISFLGLTLISNTILGGLFVIGLIVLYITNN